MKKIIVYIAFSLFLILPFSCSEDFLEVENKNQLTDGNFYQTQDDFLLALNSLYGPLMGTGAFGRQFQFIFGSQSDRILFETPGMDQLSAVNPAGGGGVDDVWRSLYFGFYRTNVFVQKMNENSDIEGMTDDMRIEYLTQARALRAAYSFYLVTIFNRPPFYDENSVPEDLTVAVSNGEPEQFWDLIEADLVFAKDNGRLTYSGDDLGRITSGAAAALLGKAMLYKHYYYYVRNGQKGSAENIADLNTGLQAFEQVMNSGVYKLVEIKEPKSRMDYIHGLLSNTSFVDLPAGDNIYESENNEESVWEIQFSDDRAGNFYLPGWQVTGSLNAQYFGPHGSSFKNHEAHPDLFEAFETEGAPEGFDRDPRAYATLYMDGDTMDFRPENTAFYNETFLSGLNNKRVAFNRGLIPNPNPYGTKSFGLKKYYYPVYNDKDAPENDPTNRRMIRYADVLLMYAEIQFLLGQTTGAGLDALNQVRERVDMPTIDALSVEAIIHERDVELALESHRWFDLIRWSFDPEWGINMQELLSRQLGPASSGDFFVTGKHEFLPIPLREINLSEGKLEQNPGW
ncbi:MAG: RagB/SusD family nutrient uptake outer membrane protein [Bacteroidota bacterium]